jgi:hypothetical protein
MLADLAEVEAKILFEWLCEQHPGKYQEGQLRTFQRRVSAWRALNGNKLLTLEQVHQPGEVIQTDGTWMNELGITLDGQPFEHMLIHSVLPYSNWEWGRVAQSESLLAIRLGLQSALAKLGYIPKIQPDGQHDGGDPQTGTKSPRKEPARARLQRRVSATAGALWHRAAHHPHWQPEREWRHRVVQWRNQASAEAASAVKG